MSFHSSSQVLHTISPLKYSLTVLHFSLVTYNISDPLSASVGEREGWVPPRDAGSLDWGWFGREGVTSDRLQPCLWAGFSGHSSTADGVPGLQQARWASDATPFGPGRFRRALKARDQQGAPSEPATGRDPALPLLQLGGSVIRWSEQALGQANLGVASGELLQTLVSLHVKGGYQYLPCISVVRI